MVCFCCLLAPLLLVQKIETSRLDGTYKEMIEVIEPPISGTHSKKQLFFVVHVTRRPCSACCFFFCMARLNKLMVCVCERNYRDRLRIYKTHVICRYTSAVNPTFCSRSLKIISIIQLYNIINIVYIQTRNYRNYVYRMACLMIVRYLL